MQSDLTAAQATDLALHFLGPGWRAIIRNDGTRALMGIEPGDIYVGLGWRGVFRAAGIHLQLRPAFVAHGARVMLATRAVCTAVSNTMAKRIASALNSHDPDRRGI
jgi:hypothetical protein